MKMKTIVTLLASLFLPLHTIIYSPTAYAQATPRPLQSLTWRIPTDNFDRAAARYRTLIGNIEEHLTTPVPDTRQLRETNRAPATRREDFLPIRVYARDNRTERNHHVTLYMGPNDLYIYGFEVNHQMHATNDAPPSLRGSGELSFTADYRSMRRAGEISWDEDRPTPDNIPLSHVTMSTAVVQVVQRHSGMVNGSNSRDEFNRAAARLPYTSALMLAEGTRFRISLGNIIERSIRHGVSYLFTLSDHLLIRSWGAISNWVNRNRGRDRAATPLMIDNNPNEYTGTYNGVFLGDNIHTLGSISLLVSVIRTSSPTRM